MNNLKIPKESSLHIMTCSFSFAMFLTCIIYLEGIDGKVGLGYTTPVIGDNAFIIFFNFLSITVPITLFLFTIVYAKQKIEYLVLPIALTPISYVLYEIYSIIQSDALFIVRQWFKVGSSVLLLVLFILTINKRKLKTKYPLEIACVLLIVASIIMTICKVGPYVYVQPSFIYQSKFYEEHVIYYISALVQFICYVASILFLALALKPDGYKTVETRRFTRLKNLDKIQAINSRKRKAL
ncbi:MAG: hypothetical protein Q4G58_05470 [bacterium]|nr:hypothetical protein [bacterium]